MVIKKDNKSRPFKAVRPGEILKDELEARGWTQGDFARFLKAKKEGFSYTQIKDSAEYVRTLRAKEGKRGKSAKKFIDELVEWQKSAS